MNIQSMIQELVALQSKVENKSKHQAGEHAANAVKALLQLRDALEMDANPDRNYGGDGVQTWSRSPGGVRPAVSARR